MQLPSILTVLQGSVSYVLFHSLCFHLSAQYNYFHSCKGIVIINSMHDVLLLIPLIIMFLLIPTVKLFSSRVYCLANFLYTCPAIVSCSYPTYLTIFSVLGCSCLSCLPSGFSVYLSLVLFQYNVCCFVCRINYPWRMSLMLPLSFPLTSFDLCVRPLLLTIY